MSDRKAILLLMFDLPSVTGEDHREYYHFMKAMKKDGFLQLQESCYIKLIQNISTMDSAIRKVRSYLPKQGNINVLPMNLPGFRQMSCLCGEPFDMALFTDDVYVFGRNEDTA